MNKYCGYCAFARDGKKGAICGWTREETRAENTCHHFIDKECFLSELQEVSHKLGVASDKLDNITSASDKLATARDYIEDAREYVEAVLEEWEEK